MTTESRVGLSLLPRLFAGERVLYSRSWLWAASGKSLPSYRISFSLPLVQEMGLCITDKRVLLPCWLFRLIRFEWAAWFDVKDANADQDRVNGVSVGRAPLLGPYLQLVTYNPVRHWWRSCEARIRLFMKNPEPLCRLLQEQLGVPAPGREPAAPPNGGPATPVGSRAGPEGRPSVSRFLDVSRKASRSGICRERMTVPFSERGSLFGAR
jgi:hypothetical protein